MYTATTPKTILEIEDDIDLNDCTHIYVTINDKKDVTLLEKSDTDLTIESERVLSFFLTQAESLSLPVGTALIQVNYLWDDDGTLRRGATDKAEISIFKNNKNEVVIE